MKKIFALLFVIFSMFMLTGCNMEYSQVINNMSDLRINYFVGQNSNFYISLSCGYREEVFAYDGVSTAPVECGVLSLEFLETHMYSSIEVELEVDGIKTTYLLEKSPFEDVFMVDIEKIVTKQNKIFLNFKNQDEQIELKEISSSWKVDYQEAISLASENLKDEINKLYFNNKFNGECYLKVLSKSDFNAIYWYFSIIDKTGYNYNLLIDVNTKEIVMGNKNFN